LVYSRSTFLILASNKLQESNVSASTGTKNTGSSEKKLEQGTTIETPNPTPTFNLGSDISTNIYEHEETPIEKLAASRSALSDEQKRKLDKLDNEIKPRSTNSKFFKFTAGEDKCVLFDTDKVERIVVKYPPKEGETESKPTNRVKFMIKIAHSDGTITEDTEEVEWTASETAAKEVIKWMKKGFFLLDVHREGSGKNDTKYDISPHL
jgi:hypothetical protein